MRERPPVPAHERFLADADNLNKLDLRSRFQRIYETNLWGSERSRSGSGSAPDQTWYVREALPELLRRYRTESLLDIPCGDFGWMKDVDLAGIEYIGGDIVAAVVDRNSHEYGSASRRFILLDLTSSDLPRSDVVLCRDCLVHLSFANIFRAFENLRRSGCEYLLTTTFTEHEVNQDITDGDWRLLNLQAPPFELPPPVEVLYERCTESGGAYADKALGLWRVRDLPDHSVG